MADDKTQPNANNQPAPAKPQPVDQQAQKSQAPAVDQPGPRAARARTPLFGH